MHKMTPKKYTGAYLTHVQQLKLELLVRNDGVWSYGVEGIRMHTSAWSGLIKRGLVALGQHPSMFGRRQYKITHEGLRTLQGVRAARSQGSTPSA